MTAGELIEKLKTVDPDMEVIIEAPAFDDVEYLPYRRYGFTKEDVEVKYSYFIISVDDQLQETSI